LARLAPAIVLYQIGKYIICRAFRHSDQIIKFEHGRTDRCGDHPGPWHSDRAETGLSPAKAVENLRLEAARLMMEQSRRPIDVIAQQTGFADRDRMRRAFLRAFGQPPQVIRRNARAKAAA
jgi:methylphosphotriester-DNA--protein-cysteine methyltransferase